MSTEHDEKAPRVVVVDADEKSGQDAAALLRERGCLVVVRRRASEALEAARALRPDLFVIGACLEDGNGFGLVQSLRQLDELPGGRRILLAPPAHVRQLKEALGADVAAVLPKPVAPRDFMRACESALGARMPQRDAPEVCVSREGWLASLAARLRQTCSRSASVHVDRGTPEIRGQACVPVPLALREELLSLAENARSGARPLVLETMDDSGRAAKLWLAPFETRSGVQFRARLLEPEASESHWQSLPLSEPDRAAVCEALAARSGLVIVASPRGEGRSTTLLSLALAARAEQRHVIAVADGPVPSGIEAAGRFDAGSLREALLQDPDVLVLDLLEERLAFEWAAACSGSRLVLLSVEAPGAGEALMRLGESAPPPRRALAEGLSLVVAQRLIPRACACEPCMRLPAATAFVEVLRPDPNVRQILLREPFLDGLPGAVTACGMRPLGQAISDLAAWGRAPS